MKSLIMLLCLFACVLSAQSTMTPRVPPAPVRAGDAVAVALDLVSPAGQEPSGLQWDLILPAAFTVTAVTPGPAATAAGKDATCTTDKRRCLLIGFNATRILNGVAAQASVTVPAGVACSPVPIAVSNAAGVAPDGAALAMTGGTAQLAVVTATDLNADGRTDSVDLLAAIYQILGIVPCGSADLDGNGRCELADAQRLVNVAMGCGL